MPSSLAFRVSRLSKLLKVTEIELSFMNRLRLDVKSQGAEKNIHVSRGFNEFVKKCEYSQKKYNVLIDDFTTRNQQMNDEELGEIEKGCDIVRGRLYDGYQALSKAIDCMASEQIERYDNLMKNAIIRAMDYLDQFNKYAAIAQHTSTPVASELFGDYENAWRILNVLRKIDDTGSLAPKFANANRETQAQYPMPQFTFSQHVQAYEYNLYRLQQEVLDTLLLNNVPELQGRILDIYVRFNWHRLGYMNLVDSLTLYQWPTSQTTSEQEPIREPASQVEADSIYATLEPGISVAAAFTLFGGSKAQRACELKYEPESTYARPTVASRA